jgi:hypothetical protein
MLAFCTLFGKEKVTVSFCNLSVKEELAVGFS